MVIFSKHSNRSKIFILFIVLVFSTFFFFITKDFLNGIYCIPLNLTLISYFQLFIGNFVQGNLVLKIVLILFSVIIFNFLIVEIKSSFLDYIHSFYMWVFSSMLVVVLFVNLIIKLFYFILFL